ncbi:MAG: hypothetical protein DRI01_04965 [Chloroflexi bacterium]|nr:MAG: hypothetical protein DRI01_04965 [Chloroflexota bacterium]
MGSTGTGRFSDYSNSSGGSEKSTKMGGNAKSTGGAGNRCEKNLKVSLEEVAVCTYYSDHGDVPPVNTDVDVISKLVGRRIGVQTSTVSELIGYLPTEYNYLRQCMEQGYSYSGAVTSSSLKPIPRISVSLKPAK